MTARGAMAGARDGFDQLLPSPDTNFPSDLK